MKDAEELPIQTRENHFEYFCYMGPGIVMLDNLASVWSFLLNGPD